MVKYAGGALIPPVQLERDKAETITVQIVAFLRRMIVDGDLSPGTRLPSSRTLARDWKISRTTAINAYEQMEAEGLIASRVGAGTYVCDRPAPVPVPRLIEATAQKPRLGAQSERATERYGPRLDHPTRPRAFVTGIPAYDLFPMSAWARLSARYWREPRDEIMSYPDPAGLPALRRAISEHLRAGRGIQCRPEEVFIFSGAQGAFNRIAATLLDPGDRVWFENPGAIGARNALVTGGADLVPVPVDDHGLSVSEGLRLAPDFRMAFVTPAHQHPLGMTMPVARRRALLDAAAQAQAWIIEDDYVGEFHYGPQPPPALKSIDDGQRVIYVGTFSKSMFPALRLGYAVVPPELSPLFERIAEATLQGAPSSLQAIMADFIHEGHFAAHVRRMRGIYQDRRDALIAACTGLEMLTLGPTEAGHQTVARLSPPLEPEAVVQRARDAGIVLASLEQFTIAPGVSPGLVIGFGAVSVREIKARMADLDRLLHVMIQEARSA